MLIFKKILSQNNKKILTLGLSVKKILTPSQSGKFILTLSQNNNNNNIFNLCA
jgi:hypothetical protein